MNITPKIEAIISNDPLLNQRNYEVSNITTSALYDIYKNDSNALIYGNTEVNGYPISEVIQAIAYIIAKESELFGKRPKNYIAVIEHHISEKPNETIEIRKPDLLTPLVVLGNGRGALIGAKNPTVYTGLVIIDTLQKVREAEGDTYSYARDYDIIAGLKAFADKTGICLILVHHTRKQRSDDNFDRISGTNGLLGAADGAFLMYKTKRSDSEATIEVSGRDQPDKKIMLSRNKETLCWELSGEKSPEYTEPPEPVLEAIGGFINSDNPIWEGTATELIEKLELDIKPNALSLKLNVNAGKLYNLYFVQYTNKRTHKAKLIQLRYDADHPIVVSPALSKEEVEKGADDVSAANGEIIISTDTVDDIVGEDYDRAYQQVIDNALA